METWYARFDSVDGVHMHEMAPADTAEAQQQRSDLIAELREQHGIPADWMDSPEREAKAWDVSLIVMPAAVTVHPLKSP